MVLHCSNTTMYQSPSLSQWADFITSFVLICFDCKTNLAKVTLCHIVINWADKHMVLMLVCCYLSLGRIHNCSLKFLGTHSLTSQRNSAVLACWERRLLPFSLVLSSVIKPTTNHFALHPWKVKHWPNLCNVWSVKVHLQPQVRSLKEKQW